MESKIVISDLPAESDINELVGRLVEFNNSKAPNENFQQVGAFLKEEGRIVAGIVGKIQWHWIFVNYLWVTELFRHKGIGENLIGSMEATGRDRGCQSIWLDTYSFQAPRFYEKLGFQEFGKLETIPGGIAKHFYWKLLQA